MLLYGADESPYRPNYKLEDSPSYAAGMGMINWFLKQKC